MKRRRGISEIVGAFIIITVITVSAILYVNVALRQAQIIEAQLERKAEQIAEQVSPLGITPIVSSGQLSVALAPTEPGEKLHIIILDLENNKIINESIIANSTQTIVPIYKNYNCSRVKIVVIRESGAVIQYNSYNDPRAVTHYNDPTIFSCEILDPDMPPGAVKEPLYNKTITRIFDVRAQDSILNTPVNYSLVVGISGIANINPDPLCSLRVYVNGTYAGQIKSCNYRIKIGNFTVNGRNVDVYLKFRANNNVIIGYIDLKVNDTQNLYVFHLNTTHQMKISYAYVYRYNTYIGTLTDTIHPVPLAPVANGTYSATWTVFKQVGYANYFLVVQGEGQSDVVTTGPMILFMSTKKEKAWFSVKHIIYIKNVYYAPLRYQDYDLGVINLLAVNTTSLVEPTNTDPFAMAVQLIDNVDWNLGTPDLVVAGEQRYDLEPSSQYTIVCPQGCNAYIRFYGSAARIPFVADLDYQERKILRSNGHTLYIDIELGMGKPKPLIGAPLAISLDRDGVRDLILAPLDDPGTIDESAGPLYWITPITAYAMSGTPIVADIMGADWVCLENLTSEARLPAALDYSLVEASSVVCGDVVSTGPQTLYALTLYKGPYSQDSLETIVYANYLYRILYSS